jgi:hypothetical protein
MSPETERVRRERHMEKLGKLLQEEVHRYPRQVTHSLDVQQAVEFADARLARLMGSYERGAASREDVLEAAEAYRQAWRDAAAEILGRLDGCAA